MIFDTETTGVNKPGLVEAAYLEVLRDGAFRLTPGNRFYARYNPGKPIEWGAMATHHITNEDVAECLPASEFVLPDCTYLIGHKVDFDWEVMGCPTAPKRICTLALARDMWPELDSHTQSALLYFLKGQAAKAMLRDAHNAAADVLICFAILQAIWARMPADATFEDLYQRSEAARLPKVMQFGKYKGWKVETVPMDYRQWYARQNNPPPDQFLLRAWGMA